MPLAAVVALKGYGPSFPLKQVVFSDLRGIYFPVISAEKPNLPTPEPVHQT
jgi:hypothetical protein